MFVAGTASGGCTRGWAASRVYLCADLARTSHALQLQTLCCLCLSGHALAVKCGSTIGRWMDAGGNRFCRVLFSKPGDGRRPPRLWYAAWVQTDPVARSKNSMVTLRFSDPPPPECPKCHHQEVEKLFPVVPRWLSCPKCGHMWSNRVRYPRKGESETSIKGPGR